MSNTIDSTLRQMAEAGIEQVRMAWCDVHGDLRSKTLMPLAVRDALHNGIGMVGTLALKDTSDRTATDVFAAAGDALGTPLPAGFANAGNMLLRPNLESYQQLSWAPGTAWLQGQLIHPNGEAMALDTRGILQTALAALAERGLGLQCGLEVEFHIYKIENDRPQIDPQLAGWPGLPPAVSLIHPGHRLLSDQWMDMADAPLAIVRKTAQALGMPLSSLEVEFGPSQVEAVFDVTDAITAADTMVLFRSAVKQALRRAGYHATFMCRPPFPHIMSSGWHLHQSLVDLKDDSNAFAAPDSAAQKNPQKASHYLSRLGSQYLAGLLEHAPGCTALSNPTINAYGRFQTNALAPNAIVWGPDNRGAMLRVITAPDAPHASRIENRVGEPLANPYLYIASQIYAGLDGIARKLTPPPATDAPYNNTAAKLPPSLGAALVALANDAVLCSAFGSDFVAYFSRIKQQEIDRCQAAPDPMDWQRREYFSRY